MRLPLSLVTSQFFVFDSVEELLRALGSSISAIERVQISDLASRGLPPVTSKQTLSVMFGLNPGLIWSILNRPAKHYRNFEIPKGRSVRSIDAPRVALKIIQKWLSVQLQNVYAPPDHVFGFVPGRSHIKAAKRHVNSEWVFSVDVRNFFPSTPRLLVSLALTKVGFTADSAEIISRIACLRETLAQGAPTSPVLSNMCFDEIDKSLQNLATTYGANLTRYADDIVFSGVGVFPDALRLAVSELFQDGPWRLSASKTELSILPGRLKVHGLLVHGANIRLTKGYRNRLRAYKHLLCVGRVRPSDVKVLKGHLAYSNSVDREVVG